MLLLAVVLLVLVGGVHSYLGENLVRLFKRDELPMLFGGTAFTTGTLRFAWHLTTVAWWAMAYLVFVCAQGPISRDQVLLTVGAASLVSAAFPLYFTRGKHLSWLVFGAVGTLALLGRGPA